MSELYPDKKHLIIMDNAAYRRNQGGEEYPLPKNVELFFLPPYSPDFNFIEKLWKVLRDDFFNNKFFKNVLELKDYVSHVLRNVMKSRDIVLNICNVT
ncbi:MAG: transposase [bacterium]